jgi:hypothetical protein
MNILTEQLQTVDKGHPLVGGLNVELTTPDDKSLHLMKCHQGLLTSADPLM